MSVDELDEILGVFNSKGKSVSVSDCCDAIINLNRNKWECSACHKPCGGSENWHVKNVNDAKVEQAKQAIHQYVTKKLIEELNKLPKQPHVRHATNTEMCIKPSIVKARISELEKQLETEGGK